MKRILFLFLFTVSISCLHAQGYKQAVGIRAGWSAGFEYRIFADDLNSYRMLLSTRDRGMQFHVLKEFHRYDLFDFTDQLVFFFGGGIHAGYERWDEFRNYYHSSYFYTRTAFLAGIDGLGGVEYYFYDVPVALGIEAKPFIDFFGRDVIRVGLFDFAFTAKILF